MGIQMGVDLGRRANDDEETPRTTTKDWHRGIDKETLRWR